MEYYRYDEEMRKQVRMEMQVPRTDTLVLGHVGNFCYQKNQEFLVRVMAEVLKRCPNARLWCLGKGENEQKIRKLAQKFHIEEQIRFPGQKKTSDLIIREWMFLYCHPDLKDFLL